MPLFSHVALEFTTLNLLKSVFISAFITWLVLLSLYGFWQLTKGTPPSLAWIGLTLSALGPLLFFFKAFLFKSPRSPRHPLGFSIICGMGLVMTMAASFRYGQAAGSIHVWAGSTLLAWLAYLRWYSVFQGRDSEVLRPGSALPEFELESLQGELVSSASFRTTPHLLLFYRGNWCPFCTAQIGELAAAYRRLEKLGVKVILISPQTIEKAQSLATRFDVPMVFMRDRDNNAAKRLGIQHEWGTPMGLQALGYASDTVLPTVILTDAQGNILFTDQTDNYRVRPDPKNLEALVQAKSPLS